MRRGPKIVALLARHDDTAGRRLACDKSVVSVAYPDRADSRSQRTGEKWNAESSHAHAVSGRLKNKRVSAPSPIA